MLDFYADYYAYKGRASRGEYWMLFLIQCVAYALIAAAMKYALAGILGIELSQFANLKAGQMPNISLGSAGMSLGLLIVFVVFNLFVFTLPWLTTTIRRLHDLNLAGWWLLVGIVALAAVTYMAPQIVQFSGIALPTLQLAVKAVVLLAAVVLFLVPGTNGSNKFGGDPVELSNYIRQRRTEIKNAK